MTDQRSIPKVEDMPPLREKELAALGHCAVCGKPQIQGSVTFYKVTISRCGFDRRGLQRFSGLAAVLGSYTLAKIMGPDEPLARVFDGPHDVFVHEDCAHRVNSLLELIPKDEG